MIAINKSIISAQEDFPDYPEVSEGKDCLEEVYTTHKQFI